MYNSPNGNFLKDFKEYTNLKEYYLKIMQDMKYIEIIVYNIQLLDGVRYKIKVDLEDIHSLNSMFKCFSNIKEAFNAIIKLIDNNNYKISKQEDDLIFLLTIKNIFNESNKIQFVLRKDNDNDNNMNEYINILSNEIREIRKKNDEIINELKKENKNIKKKN